MKTYRRFLAPLTSSIMAGYVLFFGTVAYCDPYLSLETLGEHLFFDVNLSANRTQSCASCHDPAYAFSDPSGMASTGDDGISLGDRNAPTVTYASLIPDLYQTEDGDWRGGQFLDGRAPRLEDQAGGPPLNPIEMGMPDKSSIVARLRENPDYVAAFADLFTPDILDTTEQAYDAMTTAIASFERTEIFAPFDSRYDRFLRGEAELTDEEDLGRLLFFSQQFTNCNQCHQLARSAIDPRETFTDYTYHNIGVPQNTLLREANLSPPDFQDTGLAQNSLAPSDPDHAGQFRTPTLRNVAVTGPYMHNGVFADLRTVVLFYNQYNTRSAARKINPETGNTFQVPETPGTLSTDLLEHGPALDDRRIDAIVAFLKTLTDRKYEHLLDDPIQK